MSTSTVVDEQDTTGPGKNMLLTIIAVGFATFHIYTGFTGILGGLRQRIVHLGFALILVYGYHIINTRGRAARIGNFVLLSGSLGAIVFTYATEDAISDSSRVGIMNTPEIVAGLVLIVGSLWASKHILGWVFPGLVIMSMAYLIFGNALPRPLGHSGVSFSRAMEMVYYSPEGMFGIAIGVSATYLVLFVLFGGLMAESGLNTLTMDLGRTLFKHSAGGPAKMSVMGSGVVAAVTGSDMANAASTGAITIPLMIRTGYKRHFAAAVEAVASNGAQLMPPIMGTAGFLMAELVGVPYSTVIGAAAVPGILYFLMIFATIHFRSLRRDISGADLPSDPDAPSTTKEVLAAGGHLLLPVILIVVFIGLFEWTVMRSALWAIVSVVAISWLRSHTRMKFKEITEGLANGARTAASIGIATVLVGIVMGVLGATGLGLRFSSVLISLSQGNLYALLVITAVASIILGAGLPTLPNYIILAILVAPALVELGVNRLAAHLFIFYFGNLAQVTPPVALVAVVTSRLANAGFWATCGVAMRMSIAVILVPFAFVLEPQLIFQESPSVVQVVAGLAPVVAAIVALAASLEGQYSRWRLPLWLRFTLAPCAVVAIAASSIPTALAVVVAVMAVGVFALKIRKTEDEEPPIHDRLTEGVT